MYYVLIFKSTICKYNNKLILTYFPSEHCPTYGRRNWRERQRSYVSHGSNLHWDSNGRGTSRQHSLSGKHLALATCRVGHFNL